MAELWASELGDFGGEEYYIGVVSDGGTITVKTRFYKVRLTLNMSSDGLHSPVVNEFQIIFIT